MNFRIIVFAAGVILLVVGTALAQGLGLGSGMDDGRRLAPGPPAVPSAILVDTGVKLLANTGSAIMEHN